MRRILTVVLGTALMALPAAAFARGGGFHGGGGGFHGGGFHGGGGGAFHGGGGGAFHGGGGGAFHGGGGGFHAAPVVGGFHGAAPAFRGGGGFRGAAPAYRGGYGYRGAPGFHGAYGGYGYCAPALTGIHGRWVGNRFWHPGYWGWRSGARIWIGPGWGVGFYPGCAWVQPGWVWDGYQWVWQDGYCAAY